MVIGFSESLSILSKEMDKPFAKIGRLIWEQAKKSGYDKVPVKPPSAQRLNDWKSLRALPEWARRATWDLLIDVWVQDRVEAALRGPHQALEVDLLYSQMYGFWDIYEYFRLSLYISKVSQSEVKSGLIYHMALLKKAIYMKYSADYSKNIPIN